VIDGIRKLSANLRKFTLEKKDSDLSKDHYVRTRFYAT
jgi:hypothetical protein